MATKSSKSTSKSKTTRSRTAKPKSAAANPSVRMAKPAAAQKPAPAKVEPKEAVVETAPAVDAAETTEFRRPDLIDRVAERTDIKRRDVKAVIELALDELGKALERGDDLIVPPLGRMKVTRKNALDKADVYVTKIRRPHKKDAADNSGVDTGSEDA